MIGMIISLVRIFREKSVASGSDFGVVGIRNFLLSVKFFDQLVDHNKNVFNNTFRSEVNL